MCDASRPTQCHTVTIPVTVLVNTVQTGDDKATTITGRPVVIAVEDNDTSRTGRPLTAARITTQPAHGVAEVLADGTLRYTPAKGFVGTDSFEYERCDDSTPTPVCDTATVTVDVTADPDAIDQDGDDTDTDGTTDGGDDTRGDDDGDEDGAASDRDQDALADTGGPTAAIAALGVVALGLGLGLTGAARRRRGESA